jgi:hypothetical protein
MIRVAVYLSWAMNIVVLSAITTVLLSALERM